MIDADYTLSALNGSVDESRNVVLIFTSAAPLTGSRNIIIPSAEKLYIVKNSTSGGQNLVVKTSGGAGYTVPNGATVAVYCDGTDTHQQITYLNTPTLAGTPVAPTAPAGTNTTQVATTAFVTTAVNNAFPSGTRLMFAQAAAPTGWTQVTDDSANNRMLRVVNTAGSGTGGSHSPILNNVVPSHTHNFTSGNQSADHVHYTSGTTSGFSNDHSHGVSGYTGGQTANHTHTYSYWGPPSGGGGNAAVFSNYTGTTSGVSNDHAHYFSTQSGGASANHTHTWGNWSGGVNQNHTHSGTTDNGSSQTNWTPRYIDMILCSKN